MIKMKKYRVESISEKYLKAGFSPEIVKYGDQILYEMEQDLITMKQILSRISEFLEYNKEKNVSCYSSIQIAYNDLLNRISKHSCPNNLKDHLKTNENCPLKENCKCLQGVS